MSIKARIYKPARTAMQQSGQTDNNKWVLEFKPSASLFVDPLMGWTGMTDTTQEVRLSFSSKEAAVSYAKANQIEFDMQEPETRVISPKSYSANFSYNRVD
jgi:hypothetical protein